MFRFFQFYSLLLFQGVLLGQHPFYTASLEQGKIALKSSEWSRAGQLFEMASFGFLEHDALLIESLVYQVLCQDQLKSEELDETIFRFKTYFSPATKPNGVSQERWIHFCRLAGITPSKETKAQLDSSVSEVQFIQNLLVENRLEEAKEPLRALGLKNPSDLQYMELYAEYCFRSKKYDQVIETFGSLKTRSPTIRYYLGLSYRNRNQTELATAELRGLSPQNFPLIVETGSKVSKHKQELEQLRQALDGAKKQTDWQRYIYLLMETNDWANAKKNLKDYASVFGGNHVEYFEARLQLLDKNYRTAADSFYALTNSGFTDMDIFYYGGLAYYEAGQIPLATYMFQRAIKLGSEHRQKIEELTRDIAQN